MAVTRGTLAQLLCHLETQGIICLWRDYEPSKKDRDAAAETQKPYVFVDTSLPTSGVRRIQGNGRLKNADRQTYVLELFQPATSIGAKPSKTNMETAMKWLLAVDQFVISMLKERHSMPIYLANNSLYASITVSGLYIT